MDILGGKDEDDEEIETYFGERSELPLPPQKTTPKNTLIHFPIQLQRSNPEFPLDLCCNFKEKKRAFTSVTLVIYWCNGRVSQAHGPHDGQARGPRDAAQEPRRRDAEQRAKQGSKHHQHLRIMLILSHKSCSHPKK